MEDSITIQLSDLDLAEMIADELQTQRLDASFDPWPGRFPLNPEDFEGFEDSGSWMLAVGPVKQVRLG